MQTLGNVLSELCAQVTFWDSKISWVPGYRTNKKSHETVGPLARLQVQHITGDWL